MKFCLWKSGSVAEWNIPNVGGSPETGLLVPKVFVVLLSFLLFCGEVSFDPLAGKEFDFRFNERFFSLFNVELEDAAFELLALFFADAFPVVLVLMANGLSGSGSLVSGS